MCYKPYPSDEFLTNWLIKMMDLFQDILFTLPSFIICLREACQCYPPSAIQRAEQRISGGSFADGGGSGMAGPGNNDWLMSWLGQQTGQVFFSNASGPS